jgi:hypothetical protein
MSFDLYACPRFLHHSGGVIMKRFKTGTCLVAVFSLLLSVLWQIPAMAATAPVITSLGRITEGLDIPTRLDVDNAGNLFVLDYEKRAVFRFDKYGKPGGVYKVPAAAGTGLAVTSDGQHIYVACGDAVQILSGTTGLLEGSLGSGAGEFSDAGEIDIDADGYVYVADLGNKFVKIFDDRGVLQFSFGGFGVLNGQFWGISALSVDVAGGQVYVADSLVKGTRLPMLQRFGLDGVFAGTILASNGFGPSPLGGFSGMAFDLAGRAYVLDGFNSQIRVMGTPSGYLSTYAKVGYLPGELSLPRDIAFDAVTGRLFVSCAGGRIEVFGVDGSTNPLRTNEAPGKPLLISPVASGEVTVSPLAMTIGNASDPDGDTLVYDLQVFDAAGQMVAELGAQPEGPDVTEVRVDASLADNALYSWRSQSFDGEISSGWSASQSFYVNVVNESPSAPVLVAPLGGEALDGNETLAWSASVDPDPYDGINYHVEVAADPGFVGVVATQTTPSLQLVLENLADYGSLVDGTTYFWRVSAVDSDGLIAVSAENGNFVFDTTLLKVTANMPGARVYLGGNLAFSGRFLGETPLEMRDFPVGKSSLVVERAGFEPRVAQVDVTYQENAEVYISLLPALVPEQFKSRPLMPGKGSEGSLGASAPFVVDFDRDGLLDLLVGNVNGSVQLFLGTVGADDGISFGAASTLSARVSSSSVPFLVDWNNDGAQDLLVGAGDGTVSLFLNAGSPEAPIFAAGVYLQVAGSALCVGSNAAPVVFDFDGDSDKDLLVGSADGSVVLLRNAGTDAAPQFQAPEERLVALPAATAPFFVDWDGDGQRDLLVLSGGRLYRVDKWDDNYSAVHLLTIAADPAATAYNGGGKLAKDQGRKDLAPSGDLRIFITDMDGTGGKDLVVGLDSGELRILSAGGQTLVPAFTPALLDKVEQIRLVAIDAPEIAAALAAVRADIEEGDLGAAAEKGAVLAATVAGEPTLATLTGELYALLVQAAELK